MKEKLVSRVERLGRAFFVPISVMTFAGILLAVGNGFSSDDIISVVPFLGNSIFQFILGLLKALGNAVFSNIPLIFAVGVAMGLSRKDKDTAAFSALIAYLTYIWVLNYALAERGLLVEPEAMNQAGQKMVLGMQVMDLNVFGSIIIGIIAYYATKKFSDSKFPPSFAFFEGTRFVPVVAMFYAMIFAIAASFVWPPINQVISQFGEWMIGLGAIGGFLYSFTERMLIPFGLHHTLNEFTAWTAVGGTYQVCGQTTVGTTQSILASLDCGSVITPDMAKYTTASFVLKLFGVPGAAYAMYKTSFLEHRQETKALMIGAALTSFLAGITEPVEFTFLFISPLLYFVYAILAGVINLVTYLTGTVAVAIQGLGIINFTLFNVLNPNLVNWYNILWIGPMFFIIYYFTFKYMILKFNIKTPGRDVEMSEFATKDEARSKYGLNKLENKANALIEAHGGIDNIDIIDNCMSRLRINVFNIDLVSEQQIKDLDVLGVVKLGNQVQSIYGVEAKPIREEMEQIYNGTR